MNPERDLQSPRLTWLKRGASRILLALAFLMSLTSLSCSNGGGSPSPLSTPPGERGSSPTAVSNSGGQTSSGQEELFIGANQFGTVRVNLNEGDVLKLNYEVRVRSIGDVSLRDETRSPTVEEPPPDTEFQLVILDPLENQVRVVDSPVRDVLEVTAEVSGEHRVVFFNPLRLQTQIVILEYEVNQ